MGSSRVTNKKDNATEARGLPAQLALLIAERGFKIGNFTLSSGSTSSYYVDVRSVAFSPEGFNLLGEVLYREVKLAGVDSVGGVEVGGLPLVCAVMARAARVEGSYSNSVGLRGFGVRKESKGHGVIKSSVYGDFRPGDRVAILEDVVTTGRSVYEAAARVTQAGGRVEKIISVVDRCQEKVLELALHNEVYILNLWDIVWEYQKIAPDRLDILRR